MIDTIIEVIDMSDIENSFRMIVRLKILHMIEGKKGLRRLAKMNPSLLLFGTIVAAIICLAIFADFISPHNPIVQDISSRLKAPSQEFLFGSDNFGRDVFSRVIHGSRSSVYIAISSVTVGTILGTIIGTFSAYQGGRIDLVLQRVMDTLLGFPSLVLAVVLVVSLGASSDVVIIAIAVALIPQVARLSRSHSLSIKEEDFVIAARTIGAQPLSVIFKHILPHTFGPIVAYAAGYVSVAIVAESALSFLGLGVPPPYPSLGGMLQEGRLYIEVAPWITIFPGIILSVSALSFALLGDALRDIFDPRDRFYNDSFFPWINRSNRKKM
tara:strand:- start:1200 stop:2177 length:978 start_codon:yes stop_codon:yes gene_type:complete